MNEALKSEDSKNINPFIPVEFASIWVRIAALIIDSILVVLVLEILNGDKSLDNKESYSFFESLLMMSYYVLMTSKYGATLGKMALKIKVVNAETGKNLTFGETVVREVVGKFVSALVFGIGYMWAIWDRDKQTWHDKIAKSYVIKSDN